MSRKVYEISFAIAGKMASGFGSSFSFAEERIKGLKDEAKKLSSEYKKGLIPLDQYTARQAGLTRKMNETRRAQELLTKANQKANEISSKMTNAVNGSVRNAVTIGAGAVAVGGGVILGSSIKKAMDYQAQLASIQALTGISNDELTKMDDLALKMGADTKYSALQAAQGIEELLKAGLSPATVQAGGLEAALNLATAGGLDLTEAAETMSDALNGFKKDGMTAADAANILAGAANASSTDVHKLKESLAAVGPVGDMLGASFKSVNGVLAAFSNNNLKGSDAGTSLKTMMMNLQPQTKQATALFQKYGLVTAKGANIFFDAKGELKDMADVAGILHEKFAKLNDQQRADAFFNLFGSDAVRAASILFKESSGGIQEMYKQMADVTALEVAKKKMDTAAGSVEQFRGAVETLQIRALRPLLPVIKKVFDEAGNIIDRWTPTIVHSVQSAVNTVKGYLKTHFLDNPEFQKLDTKGKVEFVIQDFKKNFDTWYANGGSAQIEDAAHNLVNFLGNAIANSDTGKLLDSAKKLGLAAGEGMLAGLKEFMQANPLLAAGLTYLATPGTPQVKLGAAAAVAAQGYTDQAGNAIKSSGVLQPGEDLAKHIGNLMPDWMKNQAPGGDGKNIVDATKSLFGFTKHANGGIFNRPHLGLLAEAGVPEAYIPLNGSARSKSLWQTAGKQLGMSGGGGGAAMHFTFAPVINGGNAAENKSMIEEQRRGFEDQMNAWMSSQRRLSFNG